MKIVLSKKMVFFNVFFKTLGFFAAFILVFIIFNIIVFLITDNTRNDFIFKEGDKNSNNIIALVNLNGPIVNNINGILKNNIFSFIDPKELKTNIDQLLKIEPKILVVKINSPGGTVSATHELEIIFKNFKKNSQTKIYFITEEILASGAYWVATSGDKIYANYGSIIGSIGVSGPSWYYYNNPVSISSGLFGETITTENGIEIYNQNSGKSKDLFNPFRKPTEKEIVHLQSMVDEIYTKFVNNVSKKRNIETSFIKNEIGALIYTSEQAKNNYLIDDILNYDDLIKVIITENNFKNYKIIQNKNKINFFQKYLSSYIDNNFNKIVCKNLISNFVTIMPGYFNSC
ncbi:MAG: hypothetical protein CBD97_00630 [Pelagibacteraceae bacterium TMED237]|nr:MAG: hypothetical protein CBD97_00630 [Pelagibacteraceae bacterium TMED237]|tara:strand:- start:3932 stop:4966 length:1035 start_codon:yes stop_codon:yes gene_type:complete